MGNWKGSYGVPQSQILGLGGGEGGGCYLWHLHHQGALGG